MSLLQDKQIAIVGGGPGGLTLARLLQLNGAEVKVYERDLGPDVRVQGSTLDLHEDSGLKALERAGLMDAFKRNYRPGADLLRIADQYANVVYDQHEEVYEEAFGKAHFRPEIDRGPLRDILLGSLENDTVVWNKYLISLSEKEGVWLLQFKDGTVASADIVIGADGANSKVRKFVANSTPIYSGVTMIEGTVYEAAKNAPLLWKLTRGGKVFALGNHRTLITSAKGEGSLSFYTGCKKEESWVKDSGIDFNDHHQLLSWFREEYAGWDIIWEELFSNSHTNFIPRPQYYMPLDQNWITCPNMTIIGDAAHVMPPYAGEGVNMAMKDALELSECLTSEIFPDLQSAIAHYEQQMLARASVVTQMTLASTAMLHADDSINNLLKMFSGEEADRE
ncbi:2-polyprenyl-6-methoxyphenol hydroxylase [Pedobacter sp. HMWF019]|uniref:FAD-dependent oxidoreductase n=1 Tax=Pedobacter sp. HMWF019 TaxID=2056856 RepID=UPI000D389EE0|nr:NAD(P)/FAD-dependent oxidoreductase [Pedobacter sp. HMWF019]PTT01528.1 2-polyprenyl-6-methoxyphenol hydroxylase [Pedobacter sp. HMWF019]